MDAIIPSAVPGPNQAEQQARDRALPAELSRGRVAAGRHRQQVRSLVVRLHRAENRLANRQPFGSAFPWAPHMDADQLGDFLAELSTAASGDYGLATLAAVERVIAEWRADAASRTWFPAMDRDAAATVALTDDAASLLPSEPS